MGAEPSAAIIRSFSNNTYAAKLKFGATVHSPFGDGPECMSEENNSTLQWFDNFNFITFSLRAIITPQAKRERLRETRKIYLTTTWICTTTVRYSLDTKKRNKFSLLCNSFVFTGCVS